MPLVVVRESELDENQININDNINGNTLHVLITHSNCAKHLHELMSSGSCGNA